MTLKNIYFLSFIYSSKAYAFLVRNQNKIHYYCLFSFNWHYLRMTHFVIAIFVLEIY